MKPPAQWVPARGDVIWLDFSPHAGREQRGNRPAVVLSPRSFNRLNRFAIVCPTTTKRKGLRFEVPIDERGEMAGSVVLSDQVRSFDWQESKARPFSRVSEALVQAVVARIVAVLEADPD